MPLELGETVGVGERLGTATDHGTVALRKDGGMVALESATTDGEAVVVLVVDGEGGIRSGPHALDDDDATGTHPQVAAEGRGYRVCWDREVRRVKRIALATLGRDGRATAKPVLLHTEDAGYTDSSYCDIDVGEVTQVLWQANGKRLRPAAHVWRSDTERTTQVGPATGPVAIDGGVASWVELIDGDGPWKVRLGLLEDGALVDFADVSNGRRRARRSDVARYGDEVVVLWEEEPERGPTTVWWRRYTASLGELGLPQKLAEGEDVAITAAAGTFALTWAERSKEGVSYVLSLRRDGAEVAREVYAETASTKVRPISDVALRPDGRGLLVWQGPGYAGKEVFLRPFRIGDAVASGGGGE